MLRKKYCVGVMAMIIGLTGCGGRPTDRKTPPSSRVELKTPKNQETQPPSDELASWEWRYLELDQQVAEKSAKVNRIILSTVERPEDTSRPKVRTATRLMEEQSEVEQLHREIDRLREQMKPIGDRIRSMGGTIPQSKSCEHCKGSGVSYGHKYGITGFDGGGNPVYGLVFGLHPCSVCGGTGNHQAKK